VPDSFDSSRRFARFERLGLLGRGGTSTVYRAHDPDLNRCVALKVMNPGGNPTHFHFQVEVGRKVQHPSLAKILKVAFESCWERGMTFDEARTHVLGPQRKSA